jgi:predicted dehydrogenase
MDAVGAAPVRLGVVGLGAVWELVYKPLLTRRTDLYAIVGVCDRDQAARERNAGWRGFDSLDALLADSAAEAVVLLTSGSHGPLAAAVTGAGRHCLCEKPLALTLAEADAIPRPELLQLAYMKLYDPAVVAAGEALDRLGPLRSADVTVLHPTMERQVAHLANLPPPGVSKVPDTTAALGPAAERLGECYAGIVLGSLVHQLAILRTLAVEPTRIDFAEHWPDDDAPHSLEVSGAGPEGARVSLRWHLLPDYPEHVERIDVHGERGSLTLTFPSPYHLHAPTVLEHRVPTAQGVELVRTTSTFEAFERQLEAFAALVRKGTLPQAGVAEGRADIVTGQRIAAALAHRRGLALGGEAASW